MHGICYKLFCLLTENHYVGSTINLKRRIRDHKKDYKRYLKNNNNKGLCRSYLVLLNNNYEVQILFDGDVNDEYELLEIENSYIDLSNPKCVNKHKPIRNKKQYYIDNKERIQKQKQQYYNKNIDKIRKHKAEKVNCDICNMSLSRNHLSRHKKSNYCKKFIDIYNETLNNQTNQWMKSKSIQSN